MSEDTTFRAALGAVRSQTGETLDELSRDAPLLVTFLRHLG